MAQILLGTARALIAIRMEPSINPAVGLDLWNCCADRNSHFVEFSKQIHDLLIADGFSNKYSTIRDIFFKIKPFEYVHHHNKNKKKWKL